MIISLLRTLLSRFLLLLFMIVYAPILFICMCFSQRTLFKSKTFFLICDFFYRYMSVCSFLPITFKGKENIPDTPAIYAANHQSSLDIVLLGQLVNRRPHVWLATVDLLKSPILRFVIPRVAVIVDTTTPMRATRSLLQVIKIVNGDKMNIMIFPEGARYSDGAIHEFFSGFVILAKKTGFPVVPVRIFGLNNAYPRDSFIVHRTPITVVIGKPMQYQEHETDEQFKDRIYQWFLDQKED
jgi:1-acyl-sn-glycerol-3-phosphate acyltransferase